MTEALTAETPKRAVARNVRSCMFADCILELIVLSTSELRY
jgi:hypothetical protein